MADLIVIEYNDMHQAEEVRLRLQKMQKDLREEEEAGQGWTARIKEALNKLSPDQLGPIKKWLAPAPVPNMIDVLANSFRIMEDTLSEYLLKIHPPDLLIRPQVTDIGILEFDRADEAIAAGYEVARAVIPDLKTILGESD